MQAKFNTPSMFIWTKIGVEAGENLNEILARKERERLANGGIFLWGVGNNVGHSLNTLTATCTPEILFSPIRSVPRTCDETPDVVFRWTKAEAFDGSQFVLPSGSVVTSRGYPRKRFHYAIVCYSEKPISFDDLGTIHAGSLKNLVSGRPVGSSQVTSVVERDATQNVGREYNVVMRFTSCYPHFVRLSSPVCLNPTHLEHSYPEDWPLLNWNRGERMLCG